MTHLTYLRTYDASWSQSQDPETVHHGAAFGVGLDGDPSGVLRDGDLFTGVLICSTQTLGVASYGQSAHLFRLDDQGAMPDTMTIVHAWPPFEENRGGLGDPSILLTSTDEPLRYDVNGNLVDQSTVVGVLPPPSRYIREPERSTESSRLRDFLLPEEWAAARYVQILASPTTAHNETSFYELTFDGAIAPIEEEERPVRLYPRDDGRGASAARRRVPALRAGRRVGGYL